LRSLPTVTHGEPAPIDTDIDIDDAKVYNTITSDEDQKNLQTVRPINKLKEWCDQWSLPLNISKCCHMSLYRPTSKNISDTTYHIYNNTIASIEQKVDIYKDLGVLFDSHLTLIDKLEDRINEEYRIIGLIKRNFINVDAKTFTLLYKALVIPHIEYANSVWHPYKKKDIETIEKVQKRATKLAISVRKSTYKDRLIELNLHTLKYRRIR